MGAGRLRRGTAIAALAVSLAACGSQPGGAGGGGDVTISFAWWGSDGRATITKQAVELFQQKNPNIKVQTTFSAYAAYWEKVATQTAGGNPPDVMTVDTRYLSEYGERKVLLDLNEGAGKQVSLADVNPELANTGVIGGKRFAVPWAQNASSLVYDPAPYQAAGADPSQPMTWEQFRAAAEKVSAANGFQVRGVTDFGMIDSALEIWLRQRGKGMFTPDGKLGFGAAELKEYWELASRFRTTKAATEAEVTASYNTSPEQAPLGKKLTAAEFAYDSVYPGFQKANGKDLRVAPYPSDDPANTGQYRRPSMFLAVSARGKQQEASAKLVNFLINDPEAGKILGADRGLPPNLKIRAQLAGEAKGTDKVIYDYEAAIEPKLGPAPAVPPKGAGAIQKLLQRTYEEIAFGRLSVDDAVSRFMSEAQKDLQ
ncbi:ABC transporter substrate-binding protein [Kibdelosporangium persicum]|uniref:Periplasmic substrate-binding component of ABC-type sugar transport system n=1 Tax=Kibdelosporangium persicum TaxID=2698649 RepID=A0ABX2F6U0_9PSEU|nr:ABC transporter substrate-binding protein [Kibdelosporangium persicum]NRN67074.1 Periplasmic substrate-binding component of ABC-type sugar transport system [Kibdelosporangium persicum]